MTDIDCETIEAEGTCWIDGVKTTPCKPPPDAWGVEIIGSAPVMIGTDGPDVFIPGLLGESIICGLGGDDVIDAGGRDDIVFGGLGHDYIDGGGGNDRIDGGSGADFIIGGRNKGEEYLSGGRATASHGAGDIVVCEYIEGDGPCYIYEDDRHFYVPYAYYERDVCIGATEDFACEFWSTGPDYSDGRCTNNPVEVAEDCDGICDLYDVLDSPDCDWVCNPGDEPGSPDCDGICGYGENSSSPDCDGVCGYGEKACVSADCKDEEPHCDVTNGTGTDPSCLDQSQGPTTTCPLDPDTSGGGGAYGD